MTSIVSSPLKINGVISTDKTVLQNLNSLANASGCFLTFDINQGKWAVIINRAGSSVASFDDSNIVGSITVSETGVNEFYNSVSVEFPHPELRDQTDFVQVTIPDEDLYPNEVENTLNMQIDCINDPIQAQYLASVELNQNRLSKVITFSADFQSLGLKAGDLIDVTSEMYDYTNKVFRIIKIEESDEDVIGVTITALEYSADVYSTDGLVRSERSKATGIMLKEQNEDIQESNDVDVGNQLERLLLANLGAGLLRSLFSRLAGTNKFGPTTTANKNKDKILTNTKAPSITSVTSDGYVCEGASITLTIVTETCTSCMVELPDLEYEYEITGVLEEDVVGDLTGIVTVDGATQTGTLTIETSATAGGETSNTMTVTIGGYTHAVEIYNVPDYTYSTIASPSTITEGGSSTVTLTVTDIPDGTSIPYEITTTDSRLTGPSFSGNVTISSGQASLTITTQDDGVYTGTGSVLVTFSPDLVTNCGLVDNSATITITDTSTAPPPDEVRQYILTPVVWGGTYDGTTGQLKSVSVLRSAYMPVPFAGESTVNVPTTLSVTQGSPSSITVTGTRSISAEVLGGTLLEPITTFNTVAVNSPITGTKTQIWGYY